MRYAYVLGIVVCTCFSELARADSVILSPLPLSSPSQLIHTVQLGETWGAIAEKYYGESNFEKFIIEDNGLTQSTGPAVGLRIHIPLSTRYKVESNDTWASIAEKYYGDSSRAFLIVENNLESGGEKPNTGAVIVIPYPLRHTADHLEPLSKISIRYYLTSNRARMLQRFNHLRTNRASRGQLVLVPVILQLSDAGRQALEEKNRAAQEDSSVDVFMQSLAIVREHVHHAKYIDAIVLSNQLLNRISATKHPMELANLESELAVAYVALNREDLALRSFQSARKHNPNMILDPITSSPRVRKVFDLAMKK